MGSSASGTRDETASFARTAPRISQIGRDEAKADDGHEQHNESKRHQPDRIDRRERHGREQC